MKARFVVSLGSMDNTFISHPEKPHEIQTRVALLSWLMLACMHSTDKVRKELSEFKGEILVTSNDETHVFII